MRRDDLLIAALDIVFLFVVLFLLAFLAIRYDANKGLGEQDYVKINTLLTEKGNIKGDYISLNYMAIVLKKNSIDLYKYQSKQSIHIATFHSLKEFVKNGSLDKNLIYVIYEKEKSPLLSQIVRLFALESIPIGIAQVGA
ncbi:MAG: hypothetical protein DRZ76_04115 [Candidatus Nealsonbacteria bacterium]|nr:MAG: hypothetical protein DRZ76_04115 [Candidatus Nealsonbacteria bacterium]